MTPILVAFGRTWHPAPFVVACAPTDTGGLRLTCLAHQVRNMGKEVSITQARWKIDGALWRTSSAMWMKDYLYVSVVKDTDDV